MNLNDGCVRSYELDRLDGEKTARELIDSGAGVVTPYGVVYDNGMELKPLYNGKTFPPYLYDVYPLVFEVSPLNESEEKNDAAILCLPMAEKQLEHAVERCGIESAEQLRFSTESALSQMFCDLPDLESEPMSELNEMCEAIMTYTHYNYNKFSAVIALAKPQNAMQIKHLAENFASFDFIPDLKTPAEYGRNMIRESGHFEYDPNLEDFYDYEGYAQQRISQEQGQFVDTGYISYQGTQSLDEVMSGVGSSLDFEQQFI